MGSCELTAVVPKGLAEACCCIIRESERIGAPAKKEVAIEYDRRGHGHGSRGGCSVRGGHGQGHRYKGGHCCCSKAKYQWGSGGNSTRSVRMGIPSKLLSRGRAEAVSGDNTNTVTDGPTQRKFQELMLSLVYGVISDLVHQREHLRRRANSLLQREGGRRGGTALFLPETEAASVVPPCGASIRRLRGQHPVQGVCPGLQIISAAAAPWRWKRQPRPRPAPPCIWWGHGYAPCLLCPLACLMSDMHRLLGDHFMREGLLHSILAIPAGNLIDLVRRGSYLQLCAPPGLAELL